MPVLSIYIWGRTMTANLSPDGPQLSDFATCHAVNAGLLCGRRLGFAIFRDCGFMKSSLNRRHAALKTAAATTSSIGVIMESTVQKSCWGVTARAVLGFGAVLVVAYLFGGI
jgi:hypothetical protein